MRVSLLVTLESAPPNDDPQFVARIVERVLHEKGLRCARVPEVMSQTAADLVEELTKERNAAMSRVTELECTLARYDDR